MSGRRTDPRSRLRSLERSIPDCDRCPDLRDYCAKVAAEKRRAYLDWDYWGRPVPSFGDRKAKILIVGLAPAAHGANRTGRMFTGDRSGDFLFAALNRAGLANQAASENRDDGLELSGVYITAAARCAPPGNRLTSAQIGACREYLINELRWLQPEVTICLGAISWSAILEALRTDGETIDRPKPAFAHGGEWRSSSSTMLGCYHVSQQNTFTGRLTETMIDSIFAKAKSRAGL